MVAMMSLSATARASHATLTRTTANLAHSGRKIRSRPSTAAKSARAPHQRAASRPCRARGSRRVRARTWNFSNRRLLRLAIEIDQHVAAADQVMHSAAAASARRSRRSKRTSGCTSGTIVVRRGGRRVPLPQLGRRVAKIRFLETAALRRHQAPRVDVAAEDHDARPAGRPPSALRVAVKEHRERIRLLARRAAGTPDTLIGGSGRPQSAGITVRNHRVCLPVAEQLRDVDRERVEQPVVLAGVGVEHARVVRVGVHAARAHAHRDAPAQAFLLVARAAESRARA